MDFRTIKEEYKSIYTSVPQNLSEETEVVEQEIVEDYSADFEELTEEVEEIEEGKHGGKKGDDSKTHKGEKDDTTKKDDELKDDEGGRGEKKGDKAYVNEEETFFPKNRSLRTKARIELNEALTKKWAKIIK